MTLGEVLDDLFLRVAAAEDGVGLLNAEELGEWPGKTAQMLKDQGLLVKMGPASGAVCPGCEQECVMPVEVLGPPDRPVAFIVCDRRSDVNRVPVPVARLEQWQVSGSSIADLLARLLGLRRLAYQDSPGGPWQVGLFRGNKHTSHLVLQADERLTLTLAGHSIALNEVLALEPDKFKTDKRRLARLVDQPVAGGGNEELAAQRRERIRKRVGELKDQGVKAFLKTVADEEGVSTSRIKQILKGE